MAIGTTTTGATPCCGVIQRTWECLPGEASPTGYIHTPGEYGGDGLVAALFLNPLPTGSGPYTPTFEREQARLSRGICPDCGHPFVNWLRENGGRETSEGWRWDYDAAERAYAERG